MVFSSSVSFLFADNQGSEGPKKFTVEVVASASADSLPKAHTCFNRIDLPVYETRQELKTGLDTVIQMDVVFTME